MHNGYVNPFSFAYSPRTVNGELEGVLAFAKPGCVIVTGRGNRRHSTFQKARKQGAELWTYLNNLNVPDNLSNPEDAWQYLIGGKPPPLWPYKDKNGQPRSQWPGTKLLDIRPGSAWLKHIIPRIGELIEMHLHDGLMLDTHGARCWSSLADWGSWPVEEQSLWALSAVSLAREIAEEVAKHSPVLKIVHNNIWQLPAGHPSEAAALEGEKYCNGCMFENPVGELPSDFHKAWAGHKFGLLPRRVPAVDRTDAQAREWAKVPGVTHVCSVEKEQGETYANITPPVVPYMGVPPDESVDENAQLRARVAELTEENSALKAQLAKSQSDLTAANAEIKRLSEKIDKIAAEANAP